MTSKTFSANCRYWAIALLGSAALTAASNEIAATSAGTKTPLAPVPAKTPAKLETGRLPIYFEPNRGQFHPAVRFIGRSGANTLYVTDSEMALQVAGGTASEPQSELIRMKVGGAHAKQVTGMAQLSGSSNYFIGNDRRNWITDIPQYGKVNVSRLLPGIDLVYHGTGGRLEYDFVVQPGADPDSIRLAFEGVRSIRRDASGDLLLETSLGVVKQQRPVVYQELDGKRVEIASSYRVSRNGEISFQLARYDARRTVVIDPVFDFSAIIPGSSLRSNSIAVDGSGNSYIVGRTSITSDYPLINPLPGARSAGGSQVLVVKLDSAGTSIAYSTVLGGTKDDIGYSIGVDNTGNAYISGETLSSDFPTASASQGTFGGGTRDGFIAKIGSGGNTLAWSTFLGGSGGFERAYLAVDKATGDVYAAGYTDSTNFPTLAGFQTARPRPTGNVAYAAKYTTAGVKSWATYWGSANGTSIGTAVGFGPSGVYLTGSVSGVGVPISAGARQSTNAGQTDSFVSVLNLNGAGFSYSTLLGGSNDDVAASIAPDSTGKIIVGGSTLSTDFPMASAFQGTIPGFQSGFLVKIDPAVAAGSQLVFSTYLGGRKSDGVTAVAIEPTTDNIYAGGWTISDNFPTQSAVQTTKRGTKAAVQYSTDGGVTWNDRDTGIDAQSAYSIAISSSTPSTVVASTDISNIYRSTNSGSSWTKAVTVTNCGQVSLVPTGNASILYAYGALCGTSSLRKSTDGGATWSTTGSAGVIPRAVVANPFDDKILYALDLNNAVRRSVNSGSSWADYSGGLPAGTQFYSLALDGTTNPPSLYVGGTGVIYKTSAGANPAWAPIGSGIDANDYVAVVKVNSAGIPFALTGGVNTSVYKLTGGVWTVLSSAFGSNPRSMAISPSSPNTMYVGVGNSGLGSIFATTNGGSTWSQRVSDFDPTDIQVHPTAPGTVYVATTLYLRTDGFISKFNSAGSSLILSTFFGSRSGGYTNDEQVNGLATPPATTGVVYITGDTNRLGFPITTGEQFAPETAFVAKLSDATPACSLTFTPTSILFYPEGGLENIGVVSPSGCAWTATPSAPWITISGPNSATGIGDVDVVVGANPGAERTAQIDFGGGQMVVVTQAANGCTYSLAAPATVPLAGGAVSIPLTAGAGCAWRAKTPATWLSFTSANSGSGSATLQLTAVANPNTQPRLSYVFVGQNFAAVVQSGSCSYTINPTSANISGGATSANVAVTPNLGTCGWFVTPLANWLSITAGGAGTGNGTVTWAALENPDPGPRTGIIEIGDKAFTVTQAACSISLSASSASIGGPGGVATVDVITGGCSWTAVSNDAWITITSGASGTGDGRVSISVAANPAGTPRTGTLTISGQTFTINQTQAGCTYGFLGSPAQGTAIGGTGSIAMTAVPGCNWVATSDASWLTITSATSGTGSATVNFSYTPNTALTIRTGTVNIMGIPYVLIENGVRTISSQVPTATFRDNFGSLRIFKIGDATTTALGGTFASDTASVQIPGTSDTWTAVRLAGGGLYANRYTAAGASTWFGIGGVYQGNPSIAAGADGSAYLVGRDLFKGLWVIKVDASGIIGTPVFLGGVCESDPSAVLGPDGTLSITIKDSWDGVWVARYNTTTSGVTWTFVGGIIEGNPIATLGADNAVYIAVRDHFAGVWLCRAREGVNWYFAGGITPTDPLISADSTGIVTIGALSTFSSPAYRKFTEGTSANWQPWVEPGGILDKVSLATVGGNTYLFGANAFRIYWYRSTDGVFGQAGFSTTAAGTFGASPR